jgi:hypothetical protein
MQHQTRLGPESFAFATKVLSMYASAIPLPGSALHPLGSIALRPRNKRLAKVLRPCSPSAECDRLYREPSE